MKKKLFKTLAVLVVFALFYQQIILVGCKIALYCFLPKTFSYQKIAWDKNVLRIQGLTKEKNEVSVDCIDLFYQEGSFHIRILHPQYLADNKGKSQNILGAALALSRFFSVEMHHGVLELNQLRYYFSLLPITHKKLELKLAMDPDPLYPALLILHHSPSNQIYLSIKSQEVRHLSPLMQLIGYRDLNYHAEISVEASGTIKSDGYIQDMQLKTTLANVKVQQANKQFCCDQVEANLSAKGVYLKNLWPSFKGHLQLVNGSYALLSQDLEWKNQLMHMEADLWITDQPRAILSAMAVHEKTSFPLILETTAIHKDQQGIGIQAIFSDPIDQSIQGSLEICQAQESIIECDIQKFEHKHLDWVRSCFSLPQIDSSISYEWKNCSAKIAMLFSEQALQSINLTQFQAKDVSVDHSSHKFFIKDVQMQGKWDTIKSQIKEGFCQIQQVDGLNMVIEYPGVEEVICAHIQGDLSSIISLPLPLPIVTDLLIHKNKVEATGSIVNMPFSAEAVFLKPLSLEAGLNLQPAQGYLKLKDLTEEQYKPWFAKFLPELIIKGNYQLECLFDTDKVVIGVEADEIYLEHFYKTVNIPKVSELSFEYQKGKWGLSCPRLEGKLSYKQDTYLFSTALDATYPKFHIQNLSLKTEDFSIKADIFTDLWNLQLQIIELQKQEKNLIEGPISAEIAICPESKINPSNFTVMADLKNLSLPINSSFKLEEGVARIELRSSTNELCITKANARLIQDKKVFCNLQIDSLIGAIDSFSSTQFTGSLQIKDLPIIQAQGFLLHSGVDKWQIDCNLGLANSKNWRIQLATEDLFKQYDFSCLGKDITISGKRAFSQWHVDQIQIGSLMAFGVFTSGKKTLHCKSLQGSYEGHPFLASGVFDLQTHTICGQIDCNCFSLKSSPFICEYSVEQGLFSEQIDLTLQDLKNSETLANIFCHSTSYQNKTWESTIDFSLPAFHSKQITWQQDLVGRIEVKKMPGLIHLSGDLKQGNLILREQLVKYQNTTFSLKNTHFILNSELNLGEKPFWGTLWLDNQVGAFEISDKPLQPGLKGCFSIESNECKLHTIKGKACGITSDLEAKETNHLQGILQINVSDCAAFIPLLEKIIKPLELEANFIYQGEIDEQGCRGLLQADQIELKGFSVSKFSAGVEFSPKELQIYDFILEDQAGSLFAKTVSCKKLNSWEMWIPEVEIKQLQLDHVLKKAKPFVIDILIKDIQAQLSDLQTLHGLGQCKFQYLKQDQFFEIPLEILSKIGLDLRSFMPVEGELAFKLQEGRCYLTHLAKTFSKNNHCKFALAKRKKHTSYIGFDGNISIDLELKQKKLLKFINPFTFTIRGNIDHPKYGLVLLKN
ncbi:MAG TPA: hypothetical protein VGZ69_05510 [Candidatus Rhabdochlamydia sp.]|jgi:hypothetical protein|nr:hypothetical protein [Candidatus Rhabdochlamydia sp.]